MQKFILVRHAKSSWNDATLSDHERPLNQRGRRDAPIMGQWLADNSYKPDYLIVSSAVRAQQTADAFQVVAELVDDKYITEPRLYHAGMQEWIQVLEEARGASETIAFFAHNPGITQVINWLCTETIFNVPTCGVAIIGIPTDCKRIDSGVGKLLDYQTPKSLLAEWTDSDA